MTLDKYALTAHHIGCLTDDMAKSVASYRNLGFENVSQIFSIGAQKVNVCFIEIKTNFYLELVEFPAENASLRKIFKSGNPYYHIGYLVENVDSTIAHLQEDGYHVVNRFNSEAFEGKLCAFLYSPEMHLIELIEA